jgi:hypothetical protein
MTNEVTGGCLCGKIRYTISQPVQNIIACHCTNCQKASGSGMSHNTPVPASAVTFTLGQPNIYADTAQSGNKLYRAFCGDCGSPIYSQRESTPEMMVIKVGTLDNSDAMKLIMNIWTDSTRPWVNIDPATEQHSGNRPVKT